MSESNLEQRMEADRRLVKNPPAPVRPVRPCVPDDGISDLYGYHEGLGAQAAAHTTLVIPAAGAATRMFRRWRSWIDEGTVLSTDERARISALPWTRDLPGPEMLEDALHAVEGLPKAVLPLDAEDTFLSAHVAEQREVGMREIRLLIQPEGRDAFVAAGAREGVLVDQPEEAMTVGFTPAGEVHRDGDGWLVRPAGHGALLSALPELPGRFLYLKTVDNVAPRSLRTEVAVWRRRVLGKLAELVHDVQLTLEEGTDLAAQAMLRARFGIDVPLAQARAQLQRPVRVCGMVPNKGEPGGGAFWVQGPDGVERPEIVEGGELADGAPVPSYFNPVEVAVWLADHDAEALSDLVHDERSMVVHKHDQGLDVVAVERPGLWNGAMSQWNTVFVALPPSVFHPVKTVDDLIQRQHGRRALAVAK